MDHHASAEQGRSRRRHVAFAAVTALLSLTLALTVAEQVLRKQRARIEASDRMDPGMIRYDRLLGWRLTPGWQGRHRHHDFDVRYAIDERGRRHGGADPQRAAHRVAVVGDSFTFGLGVADDQTFARVLGDSRETLAVRNHGVPGYSTDQGLLQIGRDVLARAPDTLVLVVYVANDLFDNERGFPLQADNAKPYFTLQSGRLAPANRPVPMLRKLPADRQETLARIVLPPAAGAPGPLRRWLDGLELVRWTGWLRRAPDVGDDFYRARFASALTLFDALLTDLQARTEAAKVDLVVAVLAGRSFVADPRSHSARYQDYLRREVLGVARRLGLEAVDLAVALRDARASSKEKLYFPNDGHLTAAGHREVARVLAGRLRLD